MWFAFDRSGKPGAAGSQRWERPLRSFSRTYKIELHRLSASEACIARLSLTKARAVAAIHNRLSHRLVGRRLRRRTESVRILGMDSG